MAIPVWGVSRKRCTVVRLRVNIARDLEAADGRRPAFPFAFRRHSSAPARRGREVFRTFTKLIPRPHLFPFDKERSRDRLFRVCESGKGSLRAVARTRTLRHIWRQSSPATATSLSILA
jgi:hypothetical protein